MIVFRRIRDLLTSHRVRKGVRVASLTLFALFLACLPEQALQGAEKNAWSVQKLNDNKPWDKFVDSQLLITVEGRIGGFGGGQLRLLRCDAKFTIDNTKLRSVAAKNTIEISGRFKKEGTKVEFAVEDLKVVSGYPEQYESRASKLKRATYQEWSELGDWIARYSRFYDDADLMKKANSAYSKAIETEYGTFKPADAEARFSLAKKVDDYQLSARRKMELIHEGLQIQWQALQKTQPADLTAWDQFATNLSEQLPGTDAPIQKLVRDLKEGFEQDPISKYRGADDELRLLLNRLFFVSVIRKRILQGVLEDGRNGDLIAEQLDQRIPEESLLAEKYRSLQLDYRLKTVSTATRAEAENLAAAFRDRHQDEAAKQALFQWIKAHELRLKGDGAIGLLQLADEYLSLLNNESVAVEYLTDAYQLDPSFEDVKAKLTSLGYEWKNSRWSQHKPDKPEVPISEPQPVTGITSGMTATDLRKLMGQPGSLARAITSRGITEIWSFGPVGSTRLVIRLEQSSRDSEPKVTAIKSPR